MKHCGPGGGWPCGRFNPLGGPAGGLWPSGGRNRTSPAATPATPAPTCVSADIFADCFASCSGVIQNGSPGPICGWTFNTAFGVLGGVITFSAAEMRFDTTSATQFPGADKALDAALASVLGTTYQFDFIEFPSVPTLNTTYNFIVNNDGLSETAILALFGDGTATVQVGDPANASTYVGTWVPNNGAHAVHVTISAGGVPALYIDGVEITMAFFGMGATFGSFVPAGSVSWFMGSDVAPAVSASISNFFVASSVLAQDTEFCCP